MVASILFHCFILKIGVPVILLCNLDPTSGLCNKMCMIIQWLTHQLIIAQVSIGAHVGNLVAIPKITTTTSTIH
uniref:DNA helicase Pif1-like 2B domain-containing protein n=2 Tax=Physcomitrium patens TaxID=3218 RepID=A0A7I3ZFK2_PHYPA